MSANVEAKKQVVEEIKGKISGAKSVVLINYSGLTVAEDTEFRKAFRKAGIEYKVLKNTLVRKAFNELGVTDFDADLNGPTAIAFGQDETSSSKIVAEGIKKYNKMAVKSAFVEGSYMDAKGVEALATIPSKDELYAKCAGVLQSIIASLAIAVKAVAEKHAEA
ncbi:MAG: 50S ribosomal protein L10 [Clostridia bacterium]|nr:50S ribosomal protein L10 [Clostridia bacterium]